MAQIGAGQLAQETTSGKESADEKSESELEAALDVKDDRNL